MIKKIIFGAYSNSSEIVYTFSTPTAEFESSDFNRFLGKLREYIQKPNPERYLGISLNFNFTSEFEPENRHLTKEQRKNIEEIIFVQNKENGHN